MAEVRLYPQPRSSPGIAVLGRGVGLWPSVVVVTERLPLLHSPWLLQYPGTWLWSGGSPTAGSGWHHHPHSKGRPGMVGFGGQHQTPHFPEPSPPAHTRHCCSEATSQLF